MITILSSAGFASLSQSISKTEEDPVFFLIPLNESEILLGVSHQNKQKKIAKFSRPSSGKVTYPEVYSKKEVMLLQEKEKNCFTVIYPANEPNTSVFVEVSLEMA